MTLPTLYSMSSKGKALQWTIEVEGNKYRTIAGQVGGKLIEGDWTTCEAKNVGRANEVSADVQAMSEATAKWKKKHEKDYYESINDIGKARFVEPMTAHKWAERGHKVTFPVFSQPKLDGMRSVVSKEGMMSRGGKPIASAPHIHEAFARLFEEYPNAIFDGELYGDSLSDNFNKIISLCKKAKPSEEHLAESRKYIQYWVYDLIDSSIPYHERKDTLTIFYDTFLSVPDSPVVLVPTTLVSTVEELDALYEGLLSDGLEGQMVRTVNGMYIHDRSESLLKRKPDFDGEYILKDILPGRGKRQFVAGSALLDDGAGGEFGTGIKGDFSFAKDLLENKEQYIGKPATVEITSFTPAGVPRFGRLKAIRDYE